MIAISKCMLRYLCNIFIVVVGIYLAEKLKGEFIDQQLIGYRERNHDETRDEIGHGQAEDEDGGRPLVPLPVVDQEGKRVSCLSRGKRTFNSIFIEVELRVRFRIKSRLKNILEMPNTSL